MCCTRPRYHLLHMAPRPQQHILCYILQVVTNDLYVWDMFLDMLDLYRIQGISLSCSSNMFLNMFSKFHLK